MDSLKLLEDTYSHQFWLNISSLSFQDSHGSKCPLEVTEMLLPSLFNNSASCKTILSNQESLLELFSMGKSHGDAVGEIIQNSTSEPLDGLIIDYQDVSQSVPHQQCHQEQNRSQDEAKQKVRSQETNHMKQKDVLQLSPLQMDPSAVAAVQKGLKTQRKGPTSQQSLLARADHAKQRLYTLLGKYALNHYTNQLQDLDQILYQQRTSHKSPSLAENTYFSEQDGLNRLPDSLSEQKRSKSVQLTQDVQSLTHSGQAVLREVQKALDSDATASSSDEEWDNKEKKSTGCLGCEWTYQCKRAELASRWTWLQLRLSELDFKVQQLKEIHQRILASKGNVVLAEPRPLTDRQIQKTFLKETANLAQYELDTEPSSPTQLLRNIERQSAQLSQIVTSLMAPLFVSPSSSPVDKGVCGRWRGQTKKPISRPLADMFLQSSSRSCLEMTRQKKRRVCYRRHHAQPVDITCVSARTRPLLTYHKPRLFTMSQSAFTQQVSDSSVYRCCSCVSCDPVSVCSDSICFNSTESSTNRSQPSEISMSFHTSLAREDWIRQEGPSHSFSTAKKTAFSVFNCLHQLSPVRQKRRRAHSHALRWTQTNQKPHKHPSRRAVKRRHRRQADMMFQSRPDMLCSSFEESTEEPVTPNSTHTHQRTSQFPVRRRNGESVYNINNIVIPVSLQSSTKVEKLQYKDILTPSWRVVDVPPLVKEEDENSDEVEVLSDKVFSQRHQRQERKEKLRWSSWEKGRRSTHWTRFSSSDCMHGSGKVCPVKAHDPVQVCCEQSRTCSTPDGPSEFSLENTEPQLPWEKRVFPLSKEDDEALRCEEDGCEAGDVFWSEKMELSLSDSSSDNSHSSFCRATTTSPAGHTENYTQYAEVTENGTDEHWYTFNNNFKVLQQK